MLYISAGGGLLCLILHVMSLAGFSSDALLVLCFVGLLIAWLPTVAITLPITFYKPNAIWQVVFAGCPVWIRRMLYGIGAYAVLNFLVFIVWDSGDPAQATAWETRLFSGHLLAFYSGAFAILYSRTKSSHLFRKRKCPDGHPSWIMRDSCPRCGYSFPADPAEDTAVRDLRRSLQSS
jgi:hypothetical protein